VAISMTTDKIENIVSEAKNKKIDSSYFDDFVHNTASIIASKVNNEGIESQIKFLLKNGWSFDDIVSAMPK